MFQNFIVFGLFALSPFRFPGCCITSPEGWTVSANDGFFRFVWLQKKGYEYPMATGDLAGKQYWEKNWQERKMLGSISLKNYSQARFDEIFHRFLPNQKGLKFLEAGCARSSWLPYFNYKFGYEIFGLDYSETGCEMARENLKRYGVAGTILCRNFLEKHSDLQSRFDIIFSYGVVEHFENPEIVLKQFSDFLKTGGRIITIVPNVFGMMGWLQKVVNRPVYDVHNPMTVEDLKKVHHSVGFSEVWSGYVGSIGTEVVGYPPQAGLVLRGVRKMLKWFTKASWGIFRLSGWHPESLWFSPYVFFIGDKVKG